MKISPVAGTPTIPNPSHSGLAPEKLARLKALASGKIEEKESEGPKPLKQETPVIKMNVSKTPEANTTDVVPPESDTTNVVETAKMDTNEQVNATAEATQPLSPQLAALAKERRALQVKERELADREKALSGSTRAELEARIKSAPLSVLQELGVTYDQLTQDILAQQNGNTPESQIEALKEEIKALREGVDKTLSDKDAAAEKAVLSEMRRNVDRLVAEGDDFECIRETQNQQKVIDLIHRTWKETGEVLDEPEAARLVEEELFTEQLRLAKLNKIQGKLTPAEPLQQQPQTGMKTLTNKDQATPAISRRQRAIAAMLGQKR